MTRLKSSASFSARLLVCAGMIWLARVAVADDIAVTTNTAPDAGAKAAEAMVIGNETTLRSGLEIQGQLHELKLENEKYRQEAAAAAAHNVDLLNMIESSVASQRVEGLKELQHANDIAQRSNELVLMEVRAFAGFGFLALLLTAVLHWRMVNHVKAVATKLPAAYGLEAGRTPPALEGGETPLLGSGAAERSTAQFLGVIERLEKRVHDMEVSSQAHPHGQEKGHENGVTNGAANGEAKALPGTSNGEAAMEVSNVISDELRTITVLLSKGQTMLKLDQPEAALACFDEALGIDSENTEALMKRGAALERLQRWNEAIECYDRAIAADGSMTMAYLHKGGVFNRMERYNEALECYEQALKTQDKETAPELVNG